MSQKIPSFQSEIVGGGSLLHQNNATDIDKGKLSITLDENYIISSSIVEIIKACSTILTFMEPVGYIREVNEWWMSGIIDPIFIQEHQRDELQQLIELLDQRRVTAVIGPRRMGNRFTKIIF